MTGKRISERYRVDAATGCWIWLLQLDRDGYGRTNAGPGSPRTAAAHRQAYRGAFGEIPAGLEVDHLCRNRACVNPGHLEAVTHAENCRRGSMARKQPTDIWPVPDREAAA